jgi:hypothetical protein
MTCRLGVTIRNTSGLSANRQLFFLKDYFGVRR